MEVDVIMGKCKKLKGAWSKRNQKFKAWYDILKLKDELVQEGMESVASNDPRTGYNLARHLLVTSIIAHKINREDVEPEQEAGLSYLENFATRQWMEQERRYRGLGKQGWLWQLISWMIATGWLSVFSMVDDERVWSEVWSPAETYPEFSEDGLSEVAHIYPLSASAANRKAKRMEWPLKQPFITATTLYDYWFFDDNSDIANAVILGGQLVKPAEVSPELTKVGRLPVFVLPAGGLPDSGSVDSAWQDHFGESIIATNEELAKNYNKMLSYTQQLVRDAANPRWLELSSAENGILQPENLFKRGAIFKGAPGDAVTAMQSPPIPVELRQAMFDYQNQLQRGLFTWTTFGNIQQQMSYLAMASVASASMQVLTPYIQAVGGLLTDLDNYHYSMMKENRFRPSKFKMPKTLPENPEFSVQVDIEIPGYLVQRATVARMLDPTFRLSTTTVMDRLFPEVRNPLREQGAARKDVAINHPKAILADSVLAYREQARAMNEAGDVDAARLYTKVADSMEAEIVGQPQQLPAGTEPRIAREAIPTREMTQGEPELAQTLGGEV